MYLLLGLSPAPLEKIGAFLKKDQNESMDRETFTRLHLSGYGE